MNYIKHIFPGVFFSVLLFACKSSQKVGNISCDEKIEVQKEWLDSDKQDAEHLIEKNLSGKAFAVHFVGNFNNDTLSISVNDKHYTKINIERTTEVDEKSYACVLSNIQKPGVPILKINSVKKKGCVSMKLDWKYPLIYVWLENDKWKVRYSNFYHSDNLKPTAS